MLRATAARPADRFPSAQELAEELRRFQTGQLTQSHRYTPRELLAHFVERHRAAVRIASVALVALVALAALGTWRITRARDRAEASEERALTELDRARGATARALAHEPTHRLEAVIQGVLAVGAARARGATPAPAAVQGLLTALTAGPAAVELPAAGGAARIAIPRDERFVVVSGADGVIQRYALSPPRLLDRHTVDLDDVWNLALSADEAWLGVHGQGDHAVLIHLATGRRVATGVHDAVIPAGAWLGEHFVTATFDGTAIEWDRTGAAVRRQTLGGAATVATASLDGQVVAIGDAAGGLLLWSATAERRAQLATSAVTAISVDHRGRALVAYRGGELWRVPIDPEDRAAAERLYVDPARTLLRVWVSRSGRWAALSNDADVVVVLDLDGALPPRSFTGWYTEYARPFTASEDAIMLAEPGGLIRVWDLVTGHERTRFAGAQVRPDAIVVLRDDRFVVVDRRVVYVVDGRHGVATGALAPCPGEVVTGAWSPDGAWLYVACGSGLVRRFTAGGEVARELRLDAPPTAFAAGVGLAVVGTADGAVTLLDVDADRERAAGAHDGLVAAAVIAGAGAGATACTGGHDGVVRCVDRQGQPRWERRLDGGVRGAAAAPDGAALAVVVAPGAVDGVAAAGTLVVLAVATGDVLATAPIALAGAGDAVAWPVADRVVVAGFRQTALVRADGTPVATIAGRAAAPGHLAASAAGVVLAGRAGRVLRYDLDGGARTDVAVHVGALTWADLDAAGASVTAGVDGAIVGTGADGEVVHRLDAGLAATWVAVAPDGARLASGFVDGAVRLDPLTAAQILDRACGVLAVFASLDRAAGYCPAGSATIHGPR